MAPAAIYLQGFQTSVTEVHPEVSNAAFLRHVASVGACKSYMVAAL